MALVRGTTPTVKFQFSNIEVSDIEVAYLSIFQYGKPIIERDLSTATVNEDSLEWQLDQDETLQLYSNSNATIVCDWRLTDGIRGRSNIAVENVEPSGKNEVI